MDCSVVSGRSISYNIQSHAHRPVKKQQSLDPKPWGLRNYIQSRRTAPKHRRFADKDLVRDSCTSALSTFCGTGILTQYPWMAYAL
jgi:hypothetical protein